MKKFNFSLIILATLWAATSHAQVETHKLFDNLLPADVGIGVDCPVGPPAGNSGNPTDDYDFCGYDKDLWTSYEWNFYYGPDAGDFVLYKSSTGQDISWFKLRSYHYTGPCDTGDGDLGGDWCSKVFSNPSWNYVPHQQHHIIPGSFIYAAYKRLDNMVIDVLRKQTNQNFYIRPPHNRTLNLFHPSTRTQRACIQPP